jgi:hypothetical protein
LSGSLPHSIQERLTSLYALEALPSVDAFVATGDDVDRERVLVREDDDGYSLAVELPPEALAPPLDLDRFCQLVEGVSHFVLLVERARRERTTTQLELELQAEVDKYVLVTALDFTSAHGHLGASSSLRPSPARQRQNTLLRRLLFEAPRFVDPPGTERGDRYRLAHRLAARLVHRLEEDYVRPGRLGELWLVLRRFYRLDQQGKLAWATP